MPHDHLRNTDTGLIMIGKDQIARFRNQRYGIRNVQRISGCYYYVIGISVPGPVIGRDGDHIDVREDALDR